MTTGAGSTTHFDALVLAAGAGSRFGGGKLLAPWRHGRLIDAALAAAYASPARTVTVVWGAEPAVAQAARDWAIRQGTDALERLRLIQARDHALGLSASLRAGVASLAPDRAGVFIFLGDMPRIPHALAERLAERLTGGALAAAPMFEGRRGHPALIGAPLFGRVAALTGDRGAGELLRGLGAALATVETDDDGVLFDVDHVADLDWGPSPATPPSSPTARR